MIAVFDEEGEYWEPGVGFTRRTMKPYRRGVRLGLEGGAGGLGHIGGTVHPVRNRRPGIFGYRLDEIVHRLLCWRMVMEKRTSILRQTDTTP